MAEPFAWRDRIVEMRYVRPGELADHPLQHKIHGPHQASVMRGVLQEVGIADTLRAYVSPTTSQLTAIDGHLRKGLEDRPWPTLILDVDDEEAAYLLTVYDEIAALAQKDRGKLDTLLRSITSGESAVQQLLTELAQNHGLYPDAPPSLADLEGQYGHPDDNPEAFWKTISLKVPPDVWEQYQTVMAATPGATEAERFAALLAQAPA
jgi:hypothetical protein